MGPRLRRLALVLLVLLLAAALGDASSVTLYIRRLVVAEHGPLSLGDLVRTSGSLPLQAGETLATSIATVSDKLIFLPSRAYADSLESGFGPDSIIVGSRSLIVPRGAVADSELPLLDRLVDFLSDQGVLGSVKAELDLRVNQVRGDVPQDTAPTFQLVRSGNGSVEVSFTSGPADRSASGRFIISVSAPAAGPIDVKSGDPVHVVFHKGPITIEMEGSALSAVAVGDSMKVLVADSKKSFSGRLAHDKAVDVELP